MIKNTFKYDQSSVRLQIDGLPDYSLEHNKGMIGIISSWRLELVGSHELEGKREHLQDLMSKVLPYARACLSGIRKTYGEESEPVIIKAKDDIYHKLVLCSSQKGTPPLELVIDDAELTDLVRCLDNLRFDPNVKILWNVPIDTPLLKRDLADKQPIWNRFAALVVAFTTVVVSSAVLLGLPLPESTEGENSANKSEIIKHFVL